MSAQNPHSHLTIGARLMGIAKQRENMLEVVRWAAAIGFHKMPAGEHDCSCSRCDMVRKAKSIIKTLEGGNNADNHS